MNDRVRGASKTELAFAEEEVRRKYGDILDLPNHKSAVHPHMPMEKRAAQFLPFAALAGYDEVIGEAARINEERFRPEGAPPDDETI